jgi:hypothetical protein
VFLGGRGGNADNVGVSTSHRLFAPRFGFAYRLNTGTVLRGGYGITYDPMPLSRPLMGAVTYPIMITNTFVGSNTFEPFQPIGQGIPIFSAPDLIPARAAVPVPGGAVCVAHGCAPAAAALGKCGGKISRALLRRDVRPGPPVYGESANAGQSGLHGFPLGHNLQLAYVQTTGRCRRDTPFSSLPAEVAAGAARTIAGETCLPRSLCTSASPHSMS